MTTHWFGCDATMCTGSRQSIYEFNLYSASNGQFVIPNVVKGRLRHPHEVIKDMVDGINHELNLTPKDQVIIFTWGGPECKSLMRSVKGYQETFVCDIYLVDLLCVKGVPTGTLKSVHKEQCRMQNTFEDLSKDMYDAKRIYQLADELINPTAITTITGYTPFIERDVSYDWQVI